jgi:hypothetical protein
MTNDKRPMPVTVCTNCRTPVRNANLADKQCGRKIDGKRCTGTVSVAIKEGDWKECPSCGATGRVQDDKCDQCDDWGWLYVRGLR